MIIRLHCLSARALKITDLHAVSELMLACDSTEATGIDHIKADIYRHWQTTDFNLKTDAWVIVTNKNEVVGYADVYREPQTQMLVFVERIRVHPEYRGRGVETLLIWLVEERAREMLQDLPCDLCVNIHTTLHSCDQQEQVIFEREGYLQIQSFLRLILGLEDSTTETFNEHLHDGKLKVDLLIGANHLLNITSVHSRTGFYTVIQYKVYAKELRPCPSSDEEMVPVMHSATV